MKKIITIYLTGIPLATFGLVLAYYPFNTAIVISLIAFILTLLAYFIFVHFDKKNLKNRLNEAVSLLNNNKIDAARHILFELLPEVKRKLWFEKITARIYHNIGVSFYLQNEFESKDEAIKYFNLAIDKDVTLINPKISIGMAHIAKNTPESTQKGYQVLKTIWDIRKESGEIIADLAYAFAFATRLSKGVEKCDEVINFLLETNLNLVDNNVPLLELWSRVNSEKGEFDKGLEILAKALALSPNAAELISLKANTIIAKELKDQVRPSDFDLIPKLKNYDQIHYSLKLLEKAEEMANDQNKENLIPQIKSSKANVLGILQRFQDQKPLMKELQTSELPENFKRNMNFLKFVGHMQSREFESAFATLQDSDLFDKLPYEEIIRIARKFLYSGSPEYAERLLRPFESEATEYADCYYWTDISIINVLLDRKEEAFSAIQKAKDLSNRHSEKKNIISDIYRHFNAIIMRYSRITGRDEGNRMLPGLIDLQKAFPEEKIMTPIPALDKNEELTPQIKELFENQRNWYSESLRQFKQNPILTYSLEKYFNREYADIICNRFDPEFRIHFTLPDQEFVQELVRNFKNSKELVFDYLSLLDLSKMNLLGTLIRLDKSIIICKELFDKIQMELLMNEIPELRRLWDFLRNSKSIIFKEMSEVEQLEQDKLYNEFEPWLQQTITYCRSENRIFVTNDLRLVQYLKFKEIHSINIMPILEHLLENNNIDTKTYSLKIGDLAERFYTFLKFTHHDIMEIVLADARKITLRSYHLVNQILLPESTLKSFTQVFKSFIYHFWKLEILSEEKVDWLRFLSSHVIKALGTKMFNPDHKKLTPEYTDWGLMWRGAIENGTKNDLLALQPTIKIDFTDEALKGARMFIEEMISKRLKEL